MSSTDSAPVYEVPPSALVAQVANAVLAAATLCTANGLPVQVLFIHCDTLQVQFRATYAEHGARRYILALQDATAAHAQLVRLNDEGDIDQSLFDDIDRALTSAFPQALRVTVGAFYARQVELGRSATHDAPWSLQ